tara:strand:- start:10051 stop:10992 length:942 start_codon:yes stop_codon:yes gene_type:complete
MWNGHRIAYISATFLGTRGRQPRNTINFYADEYLPRLLENATCIDSIIIPCNADDHHLAHFEELRKKVSAYQERTDVPITLFRRHNTHFSYGAWNAALRDHCDDIGFAFLLEDDYAVCKHGFDEDILSRYYSREWDRKNVLFCASLFQTTGSHDPGHAAISNGLVNVELFRDNGNTFFLGARGTRDGPISQHKFLTSFAYKNLSIRNMAAEYCMPFMYADRKIISYYGNCHGPVVFAPVQLLAGEKLGCFRKVEKDEFIPQEPVRWFEQQQEAHVLPEDSKYCAAMRSETTPPTQEKDMAGFSVLSGEAVSDA